MILKMFKKNILARPSLYETFQNVNVDFEDGSTVKKIKIKLKKFISNNTNSQLHQYENF